MTERRTLMALGLAAAIGLGMGCEREEPAPAVPPAVPPPEVKQDQPVPEKVDEAVSGVKDALKETADALSQDKTSEAGREAAEAAKKDAAGVDVDADSPGGWVASVSSQLSTYQDKLPQLKSLASKLSSEQFDTILTNFETTLNHAMTQFDAAKSAAMAGDLGKAKADMQPLLDQLKKHYDDAMALAKSSGQATSLLGDMMK